MAAEVHKYGATSSYKLFSKMPERKSLKRTSSIGLGRRRSIKRAKILVQPHSVAVGKPGVVLTLGMGDVGQLGHGADVMQRNKPSVVTSIEDDIEIICAGGMHTICVTSEGKVITFGCNDEGALGRDTSEEGSETEPGLVPLEGTVVQVSAGDSHSAALLADGRVFAWGSFRDSSGNMGLTKDGAIQKVPMELLPGEVVVKIVSGSDHIVMLNKDGHLFTCGCGEQGQLGRVSERGASRGCRQGLSHFVTPASVPFKPRTKKIDDVWASTYATFAKCQDELYVFGLNNYQQLGLQEGNALYHPVLSKAFSGKKWIQICGGQHHTLARDIDGKVYSLGRVEYGRLGLGNASGDATTPTVIPLLESKKCVDVACGSAVSLAVTENGEVYGWGMGTNAQLGNGDDDTDIMEPKLIVGKQLEGRSGFRVAAGVVVQLLTRLSRVASEKINHVHVLSARRGNESCAL